MNDAESESQVEKRSLDQRLATLTTAQAYHNDEFLVDRAQPTLSELAATLGVVLTAQRLVDAEPAYDEPLVEAVSPGELLDPSTLLDDES